jgi:hypothetical protein
VNKVLICVACLFLVGCNEEQDALYKNPVVQNVGQYEGCDVKFVNRGYQNVSFYIAKCGQTVTTTSNYETKSGKTTVFNRNTTIVDIDNEIDRLKQEKERIAVLETAKKKLTAEELKMLGIGVEK